MRIIAGRWRTRHIAAPPGERTRPILDRAKTVLFDVLGHRLEQPGRLPPLAVLDLFAGSGALGLEALSRGARYTLFVEQHRPTAALLRGNLDTLGIIEEADLIQADASACEFRQPPTPAGLDPVYELVFVDPPYRLLTGRKPERRLRTLLERLATDTAVAADAPIVIRHARQPGGEPDLSPLIELERRDVGTMTFRFMSPGRVEPDVSV